MRKQTIALIFSLPLALAGGCNRDLNNGGNGDGGDPNNPNCIGRGCQINYNCPAAQGPTTLTGKVTIPSGLLPLYNAKVYIPSGDVGPAPVAGASCDRCDQVVPSDAVASTTTAADGTFELKNVPSGTNIPLVIRVGKWRRVVTINNISDCTSTPLDSVQTRLPRNQSEGTIPKIALTTGGADALECLLRSKKLGLDDSEFTLPSGNGSVNFYAGYGTNMSSASNQFAAGFNGAAAAANFPQANPWWSSFDNLKKYDVIMYSCEGQQNAGTKDNASHWALQNYVEAGGRVFASHWHNVWFNPVAAPGAGYTPALQGMPLSSIGSFPTTNGTNYNNPITATINTGPPPAQSNYDKQNALADFLFANDAKTPKTPRGQIVINNGRTTINSVNNNLLTTWVTYSNLPQYFSFNAPIGAASENQCGQMVFTDMHVSAGTGSDTAGPAFPNGCAVNPTLSDQEKALIFMLFDLSNCLQPPIG